MEDELYYFHVNGSSQVYIHIYRACDRGESSNSAESQRLRFIQAGEAAQ